MSRIKNYIIAKKQVKVSKKKSKPNFYRKLRKDLPFFSNKEESKRKAKENKHLKTLIFMSP